MAYTYNLASLRNWVRDYTDMFSTDILSDADLNVLINEEYFNLSTMTLWSWANSVVTLTSDTDVPVITTGYHKMLIYATSIRLLEKYNDDSGRIEAYQNQWQILYDNMYQDDLQDRQHFDIYNHVNMFDFDPYYRTVRQLIDVWNQSVTDLTIFNTTLMVIDGVQSKYNIPLDAITYTGTPTEDQIKLVKVFHTYKLNSIMFAYKAASIITRNAGLKPELAENLDNNYEKVLHTVLIKHFESIAKNNPLVYTPDLSGIYIDGSDGLVGLVHKFLGDYTTTINDEYILTKLRQSWEVLLQNYRFPSYITNYQTENELPNYYNYALFGTHSIYFAYEVAAKLSVEINNDANMAQAFQAQADAALNDLILKYITNYGPETYGNSYNDGPTIGFMASQIRFLTQQHTRDIPDNLIYSWIDTEYRTLLLEKDWNFLKLEALFTVPSGTQTLNLTNYIGNTNRINGVYRISEDGNIISEIERTTTLLDVPTNQSNMYYTVPTPNTIFIQPAPTQTIVIGVRFTMTPPSIFVQKYDDSGLPVEFDKFQLLYLDPMFCDVINYRVALKVLAMNKGDKTLMSMYQSTAQDLLQSMINYYQLDHSTDTFSMGEKGLQTKKYIPYFRVS